MKDDKRNAIIGLLVILLILFGLFVRKRGLPNIIKYESGDVIVPAYDSPIFTRAGLNLPGAFPLFKKSNDKTPWDWMNTTNVACSCSDDAWTFKGAFVDPFPFKETITTTRIKPPELAAPETWRYAPRVSVAPPKVEAPKPPTGPLYQKQMIWPRISSAFWMNTGGPEAMTDQELRAYRKVMEFNNARSSDVQRRIVRIG